MSLYSPIKANIVADEAHQAKVQFVNQSHDKACLRGAHRYNVLPDSRGESLVLQSEMTSCVVGSMSTKEQIIHTKHDKVKMRESV